MELRNLIELKKEIDYIFESGANELRVLEMVSTFIERRYVEKETAQQAYDSGYNDAHADAIS